jgi:hypothetical protein
MRDTDLCACVCWDTPLVSAGTGYRNKGPRVSSGESQESGRPGFVHLLDAEGSALNSLRDAYDHVFVLLALATVYQLSGEARVREEIESLIAFFDAHLRSPQGRFIEDGIAFRCSRKLFGAGVCVRSV